MEVVKVLHILQSMNRGGIENFLMNIYRHIDRERVQFDFLITEPNHCAFEDEILSLGGKIYRMPRLSIKSPLRYIKATDKFFKEHPEYRICHSHYNAVSTIPLWIAKRNNIPHRIAHSHTCLSGSGVKHIAKNILKLPIKRVANRLFACSKEAGVWLYGKNAMADGTVKIMQNSIDGNRFNFNPSIRACIRQKLNIPDDTFVLGHIGNFRYPKNHRFAIEVLSHIIKMIPDSLFLFAGDGPLKTEIENYAKESGVYEHCHFLGSVANIYDYVQAMDIFCFPSHYEGLGMVVIEAQTAGLKCFVSTGVPQECKLTDLVEFLPLSAGAEKWAEAIAENRCYERRGRLDEIRAAGYDAALSAKNLENFYVNLLK